MKSILLGTEVETGEYPDFDVNDLLRHGVILGSTGSGKTGLLIAMLEDLTIAGVPIIAIDLKGDLGNFHQRNIRAGSPKTWEYRSRLKGADVTIYTPGCWGHVFPELQAMVGTESIGDGGVPLSIKTQSGMGGSLLGGLLTLAYGEVIEYPDKRLLYLQKINEGISVYRWEQRLEEILKAVMVPDFHQVGVMNVNDFMPAGERMVMLRKLTAVTEGDDWRRWTSGRVIEIERMLTNPCAQQPRVSIISLAHLNEGERQFFLPILLDEIIREMRSWRGTNNLRAILAIDECFGFLPPVANPPSKRPLMTLLKQARGYGLGVVLGTQNPGDLDYRALSNVANWWVGRLQTDRDRRKVYEGVQGSAAGVALGDVIGDLEARQFVQATVDKPPVVLRSKDVTCQLTGPMTLQQIAEVMKYRTQVDVGWRSGEHPETTLRRCLVQATKATIRTFLDNHSFWRETPSLSLEGNLWQEFTKPAIKSRIRALVYDALLSYQRNGIADSEKGERKTA